MSNIETEKKNGVLKTFWRKIRHPLMNAKITKAVIVALMANYLRFVYWTSPLLKSSDDPKKAHDAFNPFIITFWHGRHIMGPFLRPKKETIIAMFSRSADAEINARVGEKLGLKTVRGSGGRDKKQNVDKGGARALLTLKNALKSGKTTAMIADIAHGQAREAGKGIILLAKLSGRPIVPYIYSFSREKILEKTWDKTAIPLPFGRSIFLMGEPLYVPEDANDTLLEKKRMELTEMMNKLTEDAQQRLETRN
ncbi:lysophospholipid acyltransferase family protein [Bartonella tamiae]|nr:lysophospholipid acyltransferase family protein [Bartonella tamiae]